jgi:hypothetical protein
LFSAILKINDIDKFEIYIYSYHFFSLNFSFLVARAAIIVELVLGIGLISNCFHKLMWWGSMAMLAGYTLLLIYAVVLGRTDNCHCFGELLQLDPWQSIFKNIVLALLFLVVYKSKDIHFKNQWLCLIGIAAICTVVTFIVSPPDNYTPGYHSKNEVQQDLLDAALNQSPLDSLNLDHGKKVVCFYSTACNYCKMAAQKLSLMQRFYKFPAENICYVFMGTKDGVERFFDESESTHYTSVVYDDVISLLKLNNGIFPTIIFLKDGKVIHAYGFRSMNEQQVKAFFEE